MLMQCITLMEMFHYIGILPYQSSNILETMSKFQYIRIQIYHKFWYIKIPVYQKFQDI